jgi:hypothetical protein
MKKIARRLISVALVLPAGCAGGGAVSPGYSASPAPPALGRGGPVVPAG